MGKTCKGVKIMAILFLRSLIFLIMPLLVAKESHKDRAVIDRYRSLEPQYPSYVDYNDYGLCLRAADDLKRGTTVATADLEETDKPYIANHPSEEHKYVALMAITWDGKPIWGKVRGKWAFCNHSCDPNCDISDTWQIITNRDVAKGQELTTAYDAFVPHFPWRDEETFVCLCKAQNCKKIIKGYRTDILYPVKMQNAPALMSAIEMAALLDKQQITIPDTVSVQRVPTLNEMGYIFYHISPLGQKFIEKEALDNKTVLEIGAGFSNVALKSLEHSHVSYTANDLSLEHLKILVARIKAQYGDQAPALLQRLTLLHAKVPQELPALENMFDAILLDKVFHFFNPEESESFIAWVRRALKPQGRLYVLTLSPYIKFFNHKLASDCAAKRLEGGLYSGYFENVGEYIEEQNFKNNPGYKIPRSTMFFSRQDLERLFSQRGFAIHESYSVSLPKPGHEKWERVEDEEGDLVALIAVKNK